MIKRYLILAMAVLLLSSCMKLFCTSKPIIESPTDFDFGLTGKWNVVPDPRFSEPDTREMHIERDDTDNTKYRLRFTAKPDSIKFQFTTARLADDSNCAFVQIVMDHGADSSPPVYRYGYAQVDGDDLRVWSIDSDKLIQRIKTSKLNAVIDRGSWATEITAESPELLKLLRDHFHELVSEPATYRRASTRR